MKDLYEKICIVIGQILCYSNKVKWAKEPEFRDDAIWLKFRDSQNNEIEIPIPFTEIVKVHDHTLESLIFKLVKNEDLL